jgi:hypothetical protein
MKDPKPKLSLDLGRFSGLDLIVKYAVVLTWAVYAAGLTHISGFYRTVGAATEASAYSLPTVLSYGGFPLIEVLKAAGWGFVALKLPGHTRPSLIWSFVAWVLPVVVFVHENSVFLDVGPFNKRVFYFGYSVAASYLLLYAFVSSKAQEAGLGTQVFGAALFFILFAQGAGYQGDLEGYSQISQPPTIRFLLSPDAIQGAAELGIPFSSSTPGLTGPLNLVAMTEANFYIRLPRGLTGTTGQAGVQLDWAPTTVLIPRDKALMVAEQP